MVYWEIIIFLGALGFQDVVLSFNTSSNVN